MAQEIAWVFVAVFRHFGPWDWFWMSIHFNEACGPEALELIRQQREKVARWTKRKPGPASIAFLRLIRPSRLGMKHITNCLQYLGADFGQRTEEMHAIGGTPFNMTVAALRLSGR